MQTVKKFFENIEGVRTPSEVYCIYLEKILAEGGRFPRVYLSNALTSGGYRKLTDLSFKEAFEKNGILAEQIRDLLYSHQLLNEDELIFFPGDTKPFDGWHQFEFNFFFGLTILGIQDQTIVSKLEKYIRENVDMYGFINDRASREERWHSYESLIEHLVKFIKENDVKFNPVEEIIQLLDNDASLGSTYEAKLAQAFGARVKRVKVNKNAKVDDQMRVVLDQIIELESNGIDFFIDSDPNPDKSFVYLVEM